MKYQIVCDHPGRLRVRFGKYIFTKEQSYGLSDLIIALPGVKSVFVNVVNGSVLIEYESDITRDKVV